MEPTVRDAQEIEVTSMVIEETEFVPALLQDC